MLEAAFVAWLVALVGDSTLKGATRVLFGGGDKRRLEAALRTASGVALAALLAEAPTEARDALAAALKERFTMSPVTVLDGRTSVRGALENAIREQIMPLAEQTTPSGDSFLDEIGVDPVWLIDDLTGIAIVSLQQVKTAFPALAPLVEQINDDTIAAKTDEIHEQGAVIEGKLDDVLSILEGAVREASLPSNDRPGQRPRHNPEVEALIPRAIERIVNAMLEVRTIADYMSRNDVVNALPDPPRGNIPRSPAAFADTYSIVRTCADYGELRTLRDTIYMFERNSLPMRNLDQVILDLGTELRDLNGAERPHG